MNKLFLILFCYLSLSVFGADIDQLHIWTEEEKITAIKLNSDIEQIIETINDLELENLSSTIEIAYRKLDLEGCIVNADLVSGISIEVSKFDFNPLGAVLTSIIFEGATADEYETTITVEDPTLDRTITFGDLSGTVLLNTDIQNKVLLGGIPLNFEGIGGETYITSFEVPTLSSDLTLTLGDFSGNILLDTDIQSQVLKGIYPLVFEGDTVDDHELFLGAVDPTTEVTLTWPDKSGVVSVGSNPCTDIRASVIYTHAHGIINGHNVDSVEVNGTGDYTIRWSAGTFTEYEYITCMDVGSYTCKIEEQTEEYIRVLNYTFGNLSTAGKGLRVVVSIEI